MIENLEFIHETGTKNIHDLTIYALSTCGFCKKSMNFLRDSDVEFKYIYLDKIPRETKQEVKKELKEKYKKRAVFPYLVIDNKEAIIGFTEENWKKSIGI